MYVYVYICVRRRMGQPLLVRDCTMVWSKVLLAPCIYTCTFIYMYINIYTSIYIHTYTYIHIYVGEGVMGRVFPLFFGDSSPFTHFLTRTNKS